MGKRKTLRGRRGSWRRMQRLEKIFTATGRQRGSLNEELIKEIVMELKKEKKVVRFEQNWNLDKIGIDFLVYLPSREMVAIQVKSSPKGEQAHYKKYGRYIRFRERNVRCLVIVVSTKYLIDRGDLKRDIGIFINL